MLKRTTNVALWSSTLAALMTVYGCGAAQLESAAKTTAGTDGSANGSTTGGSLALSEPASSAAVAKFRLAILNKDVCDAPQGASSGKEGRGPGKDHDRPPMDGRGPGSGQGQGKGQDNKGKGPGKMPQRPVAAGMTQIPLGQLPWDKITAAISAAISAYTTNSAGSTTASATATTSASTASLDDSTVAESSTDNSASTDSAAPGSPSESSPKKCVVKSLEQAYVAGQAVTINNIPVGTYTLEIMLADAGGNDLEMGSTSVTIVQGQTAAAGITLTAIPSGSVAVSIHEAATKLVIASAALAQVVNVCGEVNLEAQSYFSSPAIVASALALKLASSATTGAFYSDAACTLPISAITLAAAASDISVYYKDSAAGSPTLTVTDSSASPLTAASQAEVIAAQ